MIGHRHLRCQHNPLEKNSNQNFAPDTKRPSKKERRESTFFLVLLVAVKFHVLVNCISNFPLAYPQSAYLDVSVYIWYIIYTYLILRLLSNKMEKGLVYCQMISFRCHECMEFHVMKLSCRCFVS